VRLRPVWLNSKGLNIMRNGLLDFPLIPKNESKVVVYLRIVWLDS